jgi:FkbM family methyltransferase
MIPVIIICYNNYKYVKQMVDQLYDYKITNIHIIDNNSSCKFTKEYLSQSKCNIIYKNINQGHNVWLNDIDLYNSMPDQFIITDPDLKFNKNMPYSFIDTLVSISHKYKSNRVGMALDISEPEKMYTYNFYDFGFNNIPNICDSQKQYWEKKIDDTYYELYYSDIDTTFCLYSKIYTNNHIRIAGNYTMKHLPWYIEDNITSYHDKYYMYNNSIGSSISHFVKKYMDDNKIIPIKKRDEIIIIKLDNSNNDNFWVNIFPYWKNETFDIFDRYLDKNKQFLDIGAWIGTTCIYASRKSSYVVCVEADPISIKKLHYNIFINECNTKIDIEPSAIYNEKKEIIFGPNSFSETSSLNDSMSQIKNTITKTDDIFIKTIRLSDIIIKYNLNNLSLIKVDIEGGEEYILNDLYNYGKEYNVALYISFYYSWWNDKNLDRFLFLDSNHKNTIYNNHFISILFDFNN